jgi:redox-sensing transcriptional repressor
VSVIGYRGKPKSGYSVHELKKAIGEYLGINHETTAVLIGAGKLGSALAEYPGFAEYGLKIVAVFDNSPDRVGNLISDHTILPIDSLPRVVKSYDIGIAILAVPKHAAQQVCEYVVSLGIEALWNFAPARLKVPDGVIVRNENLALSVALLSRYLKMKTQEHDRGNGS